MRTLVIGGVAAGTKAAAKLKREDRSAEVLLITKSREISYAGCGLPYYVGGLIETEEELIVNTPEKFAGLTGVKVLTQREAVSLDPEKKTVYARNLENGEEETYSYDRLILAVGASAIVPDVPGITLPGVFQMRTPKDAYDVREYMEKQQVKRAVVAGGGFIGLEIAENLQAKGIAVTVIDMASQIMPNVLDPEMAAYVEEASPENREFVSRPVTALQGILGEEKGDRHPDGSGNGSGGYGHCINRNPAKYCFLKRYRN